MPHDPAKLTEATESAVAAERATGAPAELLLAQWALESAWGDHQPGFNCFGIKQYAGCYGRQLLRTREWFTKSEVADFLAKGDGRSATLDPTSTAVTDSGREKYIVEDYFATFPTLAACFEKRAQLFKAGRYKQFADAFEQDGDLGKLIKGIGPIYATAPDYATTLLKIINQKNVSSQIAAARGKPPEVVA